MGDMGTDAQSGYGGGAFILFLILILLILGLCYGYCGYGKY